MKKLPISQKSKRRGFTQRGYSLIEVMTIMIMLGILATILAPNFFFNIEMQKLNNANQELYYAITQAQTLALTEKTSYQASFREKNNLLGWAVHSTSESKTDATWKWIDKNIVLDKTNTNLNDDEVQFDWNGNVINDTSKITIYNKQLTPSYKRCVYVATILGALRVEKNESCEN